MKHSSKRSLSAYLLPATAVAGLFALPLAAQAQNGNTSYGPNSFSSNTTGAFDSAFGYWTLHLNTTGSYNTAMGNGTMFTNTVGGYDTAIGYSALHGNTTGNGNVATGYEALFSNTTGTTNVATGYAALYSNTTGSNNSAYGAGALQSNTTGTINTANGYQALYSNTTGLANTAIGQGALYNTTTGLNNTAVGTDAMMFNTTGHQNTAIGLYAGSGITTGNFNICIAAQPTAGYITNGSYNIAIGNPGTSTDSGIIRIGTVGNQTSAFIAGISGVTVGNGVQVFVNSNGQLGTIKSSRRFKKDIHTMGSISDKLMQLRPVTFRYKDSAEKGPHALQYGLIAEEVAKVYPDLVQYDKQGKPFTVYYHLLTPMILSALQKEHRQNVAMNAAHRAEIAALLAAHNEDKAEIASLKQSLGKLAAFVESSQNRAPVQKAAFLQH